MLSDDALLSGEISRGDQILKINKKSMDGLTLTQAQEALWQAEQDCKPGVGDLNLSSIVGHSLSGGSNALCLKHCLRFPSNHGATLIMTGLF